MTIEAGERRFDLLVGVLSDWKPGGTPPPKAPSEQADLAAAYDAMLDSNEKTSVGLPAVEIAAPRFALPDFTILRQLGAGGMGAVFLARQDSLGRTVAIKFMTNVHFESDHAMMRFEREARAAARVSHPDVCTIHDFGQHEGSPYIVMEHVEGEPLTSYIRARDGSSDEDFHLSVSTSHSGDGVELDESELPGPAGPEDGAMVSTSTLTSSVVRAALTLMARSARAVGAIHEAGIIHRDLKPANIMVRPDGSPMILDFGLASDSDGASVTVEGSAVGTPAWMAPEQVRGEIKKLGPTTDVYALGVILYELLTGVRPFVAENVDALYQKILRGNVVSPRVLNPKVPVDVAAVCLKAMSLEQARRYETANELAEDLERAVEGLPTMARPVGRVTRLWLRARRNPWQSIAIASVLLLVVAVPIIFDLSDARSRAVDETVGAQLAMLRCVAKWEAGAAADPADEAVVMSYFPTADAFARFRASHDMAGIESFLESVRTRSRALEDIELRSPRAALEGGRPTFVFTPDPFGSTAGRTYVVEVFSDEEAPVRRFVVDGATVSEDGDLTFETPADQALPTTPEGVALTWRARVENGEPPPPRRPEEEVRFRLLPVGTVAAIRESITLDDEPEDDILLRAAALLARDLAVAALEELERLPSDLPSPLSGRRRLLRIRALAGLGDVEAVEDALEER